MLRFRKEAAGRSLQKCIDVNRAGNEIHGPKPPNLSRVDPGVVLYSCHPESAYRRCPALAARGGRRLRSPLGRQEARLVPEWTLDRVPRLTNQQVQLARIETGLAIVLPGQLEKRESILVGSYAAVDRLVQVDEAALDHKHDQGWFW